MCVGMLLFGQKEGKSGDEVVVGVKKVHIVDAGEILTRSDVRRKTFNGILRLETPFKVRSRDKADKAVE